MIQEIFLNPSKHFTSFQYWNENQIKFTEAVHKLYVEFMLNLWKSYFFLVFFLFLLRNDIRGFFSSLRHRKKYQSFMNKEHVMSWTTSYSWMPDTCVTYETFYCKNEYIWNITFVLTSQVSISIFFWLFFGNSYELSYAYICFLTAPII